MYSTPISRASRVLRVGFVASAANEATQEIVAAFTRHRPGWRVELRQATWSDPTAGLAAGEVDAALIEMAKDSSRNVAINDFVKSPRNRPVTIDRVSAGVTSRGR